MKKVGISKKAQEALREGCWVTGRRWVTPHVLQCANEVKRSSYRNQWKQRSLHQKNLQIETDDVLAYGLRCAHLSDKQMQGHPQPYKLTRSDVRTATMGQCETHSAFYEYTKQ